MSGRWERAFERRVFLLFFSGPCCCNVLPLTCPFLLICVTVPITPAHMPTSTDNMICWEPWKFGAWVDPTTRPQRAPTISFHGYHVPVGPIHPHKKRNSVNCPPIPPLSIFLGDLSLSTRAPPCGCGLLSTQNSLPAQWRSFIPESEKGVRRRLTRC